MNSEDMVENDERGQRLADEAARGFQPDQIGEPRPGPGRPPLDEGEGLTETVVVRVNLADKARLVSLATELDLTQSETARAALQHLFALHGLAHTTEALESDAVVEALQDVRSRRLTLASWTAA